MRELENLLERIFILEEEDLIEPRHLPDRILRTVRSGGAAAMPFVAGQSGELYDGTFRDATAGFQRLLIERALARGNSNLQEAASLLGLSRHALRHQMIKLGLLRA